ncbi:MAG: 50S ribosome-binding GTPase [Clostridia bacterium]|nr:50S ribosome-binding GTPase [Clostridia bacterium]
MNKVIFIGRSGAGKTSLTQALHGEKVHYAKTQDVKNGDFVIDTPGEYIQERHLGGAVAVFVYESDIVGLLMSADEPYSLFAPNIVNMCNREVIGIVTGIDKPTANIPRVTNWLQLAGVKRIFYLSSVTGEGVKELYEFLRDFDPKAEKVKKKAEIMRLKYPNRV